MRSLRETVQRLLALLESSTASAEEDERELALLLDELALAAHIDVPQPSQSHTDVPLREFDEVYDQVARRFPSLGLYRAASLELHEELLVGDAVDDLADICRDLGGVHWLWTNVSEAAALQQLHWSYEFHWAAHLRGLQWYLHECTQRGA